MAKVSVPTILQVLPALDIGGVEQGAFDVALYIAGQNARSVVASAGGRKVDILVANGVKHIQLPLNRKTPWHVLYCGWKLYWWVKSEKPALIHARSRLPAWICFIVARATGTPFVTTVHGTHKAGTWLKRFYNSIMVRGDVVMAISNFIADHVALIHGFPREKIMVVPRGMDENIYKKDAVSPQVIQNFRTAWGAVNTTPVILMPGRLTHWKGQHIFIEALGLVKDIPWVAVIAGGEEGAGAYTRALKEIARTNGIAQRVIFTGSQMNLVDFYAASDVVVSASVEPEAFGRVAVEAQMMSKPIIATNHGGAVETVQNGITGYLVLPNDPVDMARALRQTLTQPTDLPKVGEAGRAWVVQHYTVQRMCKTEWNIYEQIIAKQNIPV